MRFDSLIFVVIAGLLAYTWAHDFYELEVLWEQFVRALAHAAVVS